MGIISSEKFETTIQYETENPVQNAINKLKNHPSIKTIVSKINLNKIYSFCPVPPNETLKQTKKLDIEKAKQKNNIPKKSPFFFQIYST